MPITVQPLIYSGCKDPTFELTPEEEKKINLLLKEVFASPVENPSLPDPKLGYGGILIILKEKDFYPVHWIRVQKGIVIERKDLGKDLEESFFKDNVLLEETILNIIKNRNETIEKILEEMVKYDS